MAYYAYKNVRDLLPEFIIKAQGEEYEGDSNYDGDMWYATAEYIEELIYALKQTGHSLDSETGKFI